MWPIVTGFCGVLGLKWEKPSVEKTTYIWLTVITLLSLLLHIVYICLPSFKYIFKFMFVCYKKIAKQNSTRFFESGEHRVLRYMFVNKYTDRLHPPLF